MSLPSAVLITLSLTVAACGSDSDPPESGEHVSLVRGTLNDPATARATHDLGAAAAEARARSLGDVAHVVGLGGSIFGTAPTQWLAIDRWAAPDGIDEFYADPSFQQGLAALASASSIDHFRRESTWHEWGSYDAGSGRPRWYVIVRGRLADPAMAQVQHDAAAAQFEAPAIAAGDLAHLVFAGRRDAAEFLAIDVWIDPVALEAFYADPAFQESTAGLFAAAPTVTVYHGTNWHQWGSPGKPTLDGAWQITSFTCAAQPLPIGDFVFEVRGAAGTFVQSFDPGCVATYDETYAYPAGDSFEITAASVTCDPSTTCMAILGAPCLPAPPPTPFAWDLAGDTLGFTRTATGPGDLPCQPGDAVAFEMSRHAL